MDAGIERIRRLSAERKQADQRREAELAEQVLKVLPKPKLEGFQHPFADDNLWR